MAFTPKNAAVVTPNTIQPAGFQIYFRPTPATNDPFIDFGYSVLTNRARAQVTFDVLVNRDGTDNLAKRIVKNSSETLTFYSKNNTDEDIAALHAGLGTGSIKGTASVGQLGVDGFTDAAAPAVGEAILVFKPIDQTQLIRLSWFPFCQLTGNAEATEDILRYPQFDLTNLAWGANFQANTAAALKPYVTLSNGVRVALFSTFAAYDNLMTTIQANTSTVVGGGTAPYVPAAGGTTFAPSTAYALNQRVNPTNTVTYPYQYNVTTAGTSGATEPVWPTAPGSTVTSGTVVFTRI